VIRKTLTSIAIVAGVLTAPAEGAPEVRLTSDERAGLDTFEGHTLARADKAFAEGSHKQAAAEYEAFILEFGKSQAIPYAVLRKARCLHLDGKRYEAIKQYADVLDYFPNAVKYAAAALYYQGLCHWENGEAEKAYAAWAKLARDADYSKHFLAADALNRLADHMAATHRADKAAVYYRQVAVNFRTSHPEAARDAIGKVVRHYVRTSPDEPALRAFYREAGTFAYRPRKVGEDVAADRDYWSAVRSRVRQLGTFDSDQGELRDRYYRYWWEAMKDRFADWDDFRIDAEAFRLAWEQDVAGWMKRLDEQFARHQTPGDYDRIVKWIRLFGAHKTKALDYYNQIDFARMSNDQIVALTKTLYDSVKDAAMARNCFGQLKLGSMPDRQKARLARYLWDKDAELVRDTCRSFADKHAGRYELLEYYHRQRDAARGVPLADELAGVPAYAQGALWRKGWLLEHTGKLKEAIAAYRRADNPPQNLWRIARCYARAGQVAQAVQQLREVERFFKDHSAEAALRIADVYRDAKMKDPYVASLRGVLKKYPGSRQSSDAHVRLEEMGIRTGGAEDSEE